MVVFHEELVHFGGVHGYSGLAKDFIKFFELEEVVVDHVLAGHSIGFQNTCIDKGALLS